MKQVQHIGITGATGMIGSRFLAYISHAFPELRIRCLARNIPAGKWTKNIEWFSGDLMSEADCAEFVQGLDSIGHFAQSNTPAISDRHWPSDLVTNIGATLNLLEALRQRKSGICHLVFASSGGAVYGGGVAEDGLYSESAQCLPLSPYGIQKLALEHYLHLASQQGWITASVLRFSNVYGDVLPAERRQGLIGVAVARMMSAQKVPVFGSETTVRDYVHVDDVVRAVLLAMNQEKPFEIYNIGAGVGHSVRDVLDILGEVSGSPVQTEVSDFGKSSFALTPRVVLSIQKAKLGLSWQPEISLHDGISRLWKIAEVRSLEKIC
jgi:UDP-glucose 4-epimerase